MNKRLGKQTIKFDKPPMIKNSSAIVGVKEGDGPLGKYFDMVLTDDRFECETWESAESKLQKESVLLTLAKEKLKPTDVDFIFAGDLMNQCAATHYGIRDLGIPFFGVYGACSTMTESITLGAISIAGGFAKRVLAVTSSHFCSAEKQFRFPLEYGGQRTPSSQWTVTGGGSVLLTDEEAESGNYITYATIGKIIDLGITDVNNMGGAMAPAAIDTIIAHFNETKRKPSFYDAIITGDLGMVGSEILVEQLKKEKIDISKLHKDCGKMIFDFEKQDVSAGGSGCGCIGSVLCGYILKNMDKLKYRRILVIATGALMNTSVVLQGESIPCIAHAIVIEREG